MEGLSTRDMGGLLGGLLAR